MTVTGINIDKINEQPIDQVSRVPEHIQRTKNSHGNKEQFIFAHLHFFQLNLMDAIKPSSIKINKLSILYKSNVTIIFDISTQSFTLTR